MGLTLLAKDFNSTIPPVAGFEKEFIHHQELIFYHVCSEGHVLGACRLSWTDQGLDKNCEATLEGIDNFIKAIHQIDEALELTEYKVLQPFTLEDVCRNLIGMATQFSRKFRQYRYNKQSF